MIFNYKEDRLPLCVIFSYFIADILVYLNAESISFLIFWFVLGIWPKGNICAWNHHHQHCFTFKNKLSNRLLEIMYALQTGVFGYTWVLHHNLGHHMNYLDQSKDESGWQDRHGNTMKRLKYTMVVTMTSYYRAFKVGLKYPKVLKKFILMSVVTLAILSVLTFYRPLQAILVFWIPMLVSLVLTCDATYNHHHDLSTDNVHHASRNVVSSLWYNRLTGNLGYHTAHHIKFGIHWSKLPKLHEKIKHQIPAECYGSPMFLFKGLDALSNIAGHRRGKWLRKPA